jgi:hypothetical protein
MKAPESLSALIELMTALSIYEKRHGHEPIDGVEDIKRLRIPRRKKEILIAEYIGLQAGKEMGREAAHD